MIKNKKKMPLNIEVIDENAYFQFVLLNTHKTDFYN